MSNIELPYCNRCCCCLPIRHSLIVWAFLKLVVALLPIATLFRWTYFVFVFWVYVKTPEYICLFTSIALMSINCSITVFCIVAMLKKRKKLMEFYLRCEVIAIVINTAVISIVITLFIVQNVKNGRHNFQDWRFGTLWFIFFFIFIGSQVYVALLVRSKLKLMADKEGFRFQNNSAEAECTYYGHRDDVTEVVIGNNGIPDNSDGRDEHRDALQT